LIDCGTAIPYDRTIHKKQKENPSPRNIRQLKLPGTIVHELYFILTPEEKPKEETPNNPAKIPFR